MKSIKIILFCILIQLTLAQSENIQTRNIYLKLVGQFLDFSNLLIESIPEEIGPLRQKPCIKRIQELQRLINDAALQRESNQDLFYKLSKQPSLLTKDCKAFFLAFYNKGQCIQFIQIDQFNRMQSKSEFEEYIYRTPTQKEKKLVSQQLWNYVFPAAPFRKLELTDDLLNVTQQPDKKYFNTSDIEYFFQGYLQGSKDSLSLDLSVCSERYQKYKFIEESIQKSQKNRLEQLDDIEKLTIWTLLPCHALLETPWRLRTLFMEVEEQLTFYDFLVLAWQNYDDLLNFHWANENKNYTESGRRLGNLIGSNIIYLESMRNDYNDDLDEEFRENVKERKYEL